MRRDYIFQEQNPPSVVLLFFVPGVSLCGHGENFPDPSGYFLFLLRSFISFFPV